MHIKYRRCGASFRPKSAKADVGQGFSKILAYTLGLRGKPVIHIEDNDPTSNCHVSKEARVPCNEEYSTAINSKSMNTRSSWLNCALRDDEAVYWFSIGHYKAVAVGNR